MISSSFNTPQQDFCFFEVDSYKKKNKQAQRKKMSQRAKNIIKTKKKFIVKIIKERLKYFFYHFYEIIFILILFRNFNFFFLRQKVIINNLNFMVTFFGALKFPNLIYHKLN